MRRDALLGVACIATAVFACRPSPEEKAPPPRASSVSPHEALDQMDTRAPVPLLPMMARHQKESMREHLDAVQAIVLALAAKDFDAVERAGARLGYSDSMGRMCSHMGAGAPGFTEQALHFHHTADEISAAARRRDGEAVLASLGKTLATCTTCHASFRQHVVDADTWASMTKQTPPHP